MAMIPTPSEIQNLVAELTKAIDDLYDQAVNDEVDNEFIELYVKSSGLDQTDLAFRAEVNERGALVSVVDGTGGTYQLPFPPVPLSPEARASVQSLTERLLVVRSDANAIRESRGAGQCELIIRFDTIPERFSLVRRRPSESPDVLGQLSINE